MPRPHRPIPAIVAEKASTNYTVLEDGCWKTNWSINRLGYGTITYRDPATGKDSLYLAHRGAWTAANGPITDGLVVDHICFNRYCVNPAHLRLLTLRANSQRHRDQGRDFPVGECSNGHPDSFLTMYTWKGKPPQRGCSECLRERNDAKSKIRWALRQLEIAFGAGDWATKGKAYSSTLNQREARREAIRSSAAWSPLSQVSEPVVPELSRGFDPGAEWTRLGMREEAADS